jgi:hypothetical protein
MVIVSFVTPCSARAAVRLTPSATNAVKMMGFLPNIAVLSSFLLTERSVW